MNVTNAIDQVIERSDNIKGSPADYADRRLRLLDYLRETVDDIWWQRDIGWRFRRVLVTIPAGIGFELAPADFSSWGFSGGVYRITSSGGDGLPLTPVSESEIFNLREQNYRTNDPEVYALFGIDDAISGTGTFRQLLQIPWNDADVPLALWFVAKPPTLDEAANVENLRYIPEQYHQKVIIAGMRYRSRESKSDVRWQNSKQEYEAGKKWMLTEEARGRNTPRSLPSFFGDR